MNILYFIIIIVIITILKYKKKELFSLSKPIKIAILVISDKNTKNKRWILEKEFWKKYMNTSDIDCYFIECSDNSNIQNNTINNKCKESIIPGIFEKTLLSLNKIKNKYDFYIRTNLSTFVIFDHLKYHLKSLPNKKYIYSGYMYKDITDYRENIKIGYTPKFISGMSIILNNNSVNLLVKKGFDQKYNNNLNDDVNISKIFIDNNLSDYINDYNKNWRYIINNKLDTKTINIINKYKYPFIRCKFNSNNLDKLYNIYYNL